MGHHGCEVHLKSDFTFLCLFFCDSLRCEVLIKQDTHFLWFLGGRTGRDVKLTVTSIPGDRSLLCGSSLIPTKVAILAKQVVLINKINWVAVLVAILITAGSKLNLWWERPFKFLLRRELGDFLLQADQLFLEVLIITTSTSKYTANAKHLEHVDWFLVVTWVNIGYNLTFLSTIFVLCLFIGFILTFLAALCIFGLFWWQCVKRSLNLQIWFIERLHL